MTDGTGAATAINTYDAFGAPDANNQGRFQYTGQMWLPEVGLYHYKFRTYSPGLGRFLQADPIGYIAGMNLYAYVGNDPVNNRDPWGLEDCKPEDAECNKVVSWGSTLAHFFFGGGALFGGGRPIGGSDRRRSSDDDSDEDNDNDDDGCENPTPNEDCIVSRGTRPDDEGLEPGEDEMAPINPRLPFKATVWGTVTCAGGVAGVAIGAAMGGIGAAVAGPYAVAACGIGFGLGASAAILSDDGVIDRLDRALPDKSEFAKRHFDFCTRHPGAC